jgi:rhodanese-related sulfurtransferase
VEFVQFLQHNYNWAWAMIAVVSGTMLIWPYIQRARGGTREVGTLQATQLINHANALLLDVRETKEYEGGKLPNAMHLPLSQLKDRKGELAKYAKRPVIAYCDRGNASRSAGGLLKEAGFADVYLLQGGFQAWKSAGLPVESIA